VHNSSLAERSKLDPIVRPFVEFLLWMSGVDPGEARDAREQRRYAAIGALMTFMFGWSTVAMGHALAAAVQSKTVWAAIGFGAAWATLLTILDRILVGMPLMKDSLPYRFFQVFLIRGALAVVGSFVTAMMALLFIFHADVAAQEAQNLATSSASITGPAMRTQPVLTAQQAIKDDNAKMASLAAAVTNTRNLVTQDQKQVACEAAGTCGTETPDDPNHIGWATKLDIQKEQGDQSDLTADIANQAKQKPALQADVAAQNKIIQDVVANAAATANAQQTGIQAQTDALRTLIKTEWTMKLWVALIVAIDLSVILIKAFLPASGVDRMHRDRHEQETATRIAYGTSAEREAVIAASVKRKAERVEARDRLDHMIELNRLLAVEQRLNDKKSQPSSAPSPNGRASAPSRRLITLGTGGVTLVALVALTSHFTQQSHSRLNANAQPPRAGASTSATKTIRPATFADQRLPAPATSLAASARSYLASATGKPLLSLHMATAASVARYSPESCRTVTGMLHDPSLNLQAASSAPDAVLSELALDEIHDVASLSGCSTTAQAQTLSHLSGIDSLLKQRLRQDGAPV
jgi:hypothetical protein